MIDPTAAVADAPHRRRSAAPLPGLTVVLPCFNEAPNVARAIHAARWTAIRHAREHQIVVVDDGSTDGTGRIAAEVARRVPHVRVVAHDRNRGYGAALTSGLHAATMPWVLLTDGDLQFDLGQLQTFVPLAEEADLVIGWRTERRDPLHRRVNAAAWNRLVRHALGLRVRDVDCAFKLVRRAAVESLPLASTGAMISAELLIRAQTVGARVREVGVAHRPRQAGRQSGGNPRVVLRALRELRQLRRELRGSPRRVVIAPAARAASV